MPPYIGKTFTRTNVEDNRGERRLPYKMIAHKEMFTHGRYNGQKVKHNGSFLLESILGQINSIMWTGLGDGPGDVLMRMRPTHK